MTKEELYQEMTEAIVVGVETTALRLTREALERGYDPLEIIHEGLMPGLEIVGTEYDTGVCFVPELVVAGRVMQGAMNLVEAELRSRAEEVPKAGTVVLGTVAGDVHTIGKDLVGTLLNINGFDVVDVGCNVPTSVVIDKVRDVEPEILGLSSLLTTTLPMQQEAIQALAEAGLSEKVRVIVGGASTTREWAEKIGADAYAADATEAVSVCLRLVGVATT